MAVVTQMQGAPEAGLFSLLFFLGALFFGLCMTVPIGGADMPVVIDPVQALSGVVETHALFADGEPDVVLAAARGRGGSDTGLLPYQLAQALGWPIATDIGAPMEQTSSGQLALAQFRAGGAVKPVSVTLPCVVTVPETARCAPAFVFARQRETWVDEEVVTVHPASAEEEVGTLRPYRRRPKLISGASKDSGGGQLMVDRSISSKAGRSVSIRRSPASVGATLLVVRVRSRRPSLASSRRRE